MPMHSKNSHGRDDWKHGFHEGVARVGSGRPTLQRAPTPAWETGGWRSKARTGGMVRASTRPGQRGLFRQTRRPAQEEPEVDRLPPRSGTNRARWPESLESAERCPARRGGPHPSMRVSRNHRPGLQPACESGSGGSSGTLACARGHRPLAETAPLWTKWMGCHPCRIQSAPHVQKRPRDHGAQRLIMPAVAGMRPCRRTSSRCG